MMTAICLFLAISALPANQRAWQLNRSGIHAADVDALDGVAIVRANGRESVTNLSQVFVVERVVVLDAAFSLRGDARLVVPPAGRHESLAALTPGKTYLVLGTMPKDGAMRSFRGNDREDPGWRPFADATAGDFAGLGRVATRQTRLSPGDGRLEVVQNSIADAFRGASDEEARDLRAFMDNLRGLAFPGQPEFNSRPEDAFSPGREESPLVRRIRAAIASERPYVRVQALAALNSWLVRYTQDDLLDAILDCGSDPTLFKDGDWIPDIVHRNREPGWGVPPDERRRPYNLQDGIARLESARNVAVKRYILREGFPAPGDDLKRRFARMLNDPDRHCRAFVARQLAGWERDYEKGPQIEYGRNLDTGEATYAFPNLEEVLPYWRQRYGVPEP